VTCTERLHASAHQQEKLKSEEQLNACTSWEFRNLSDPEHRIIESFMLEKILKIIKSNHKPNTVKSTTKPCP